jgi:hypothetical protein
VLRGLGAAIAGLPLRSGDAVAYGRVVAIQTSGDIGLSPTWAGIGPSPISRRIAPSGVCNGHHSDVPEAAGHRVKLIGDVVLGLRHTRACPTSDDVNGFGEVAIGQFGLHLRIHSSRVWNRAIVHRPT